MGVVKFENEGNLWGVPYGDCILYGDDGKYWTTLFNYEVAMDDLFIKDLSEEVIGVDTAKDLINALNIIIERHESGEFKSG
jgi:hypothetical protein